MLTDDEIEDFLRSFLEGVPTEEDAEGQGAQGEDLSERQGSLTPAGSDAAPVEEEAGEGEDCPGLLQRRPSPALPVGWSLPRGEPFLAYSALGELGSVVVGGGERPPEDARAGDPAGVEGGSLVSPVPTPEDALPKSCTALKLWG